MLARALTSSWNGTMRRVAVRPAPPPAAPATPLPASAPSLLVNAVVVALLDGSGTIIASSAPFGSAVRSAVMAAVTPAIAGAEDVSISEPTATTTPSAPAFPAFLADHHVMQCLFHPYNYVKCVAHVRLLLARRGRGLQTHGIGLVCKARAAGVRVARYVHNGLQRGAYTCMHPYDCLY